MAELQRLGREGVPIVPSREFVADFVRAQRAIMGWKQDTLAAVAAVSLSTIARIERAEAVTNESLDRVATALHQKRGAFTQPRVPLTSDQLECALEESLAPFADTVPVPVQPLKTQPQIAALARTHFNLIDGTRLGEPFEGDVTNLRDVLGFVAFVLGTDDKDAIIQIQRSEPVKRRELYAMVLNVVHDIERRGRAVALAGTYVAPTDAPHLLPTADVGLITFFSRDTDPAAAKRKMLFAPALIDLKLLLKRSSVTE